MNQRRTHNVGKALAGIGVRPIRLLDRRPVEEVTADSPSQAGKPPALGTRAQR